MPSDTSPGTFTSSDVAGLMRESVVAMEGLASYRQEFTFRPEGKPITFLVDDADPGDYYERLASAPDSEQSFEVILLGKETYVRNCDHYPDDCTDWEQSHDNRPPVPGAGGLTTVGPETLGLAAVGLLRQPDAVGVEEINGATLLHVQGTINLSRTIYENQRRLLEATDKLESCESGSGAEYSNGRTTTTTPLSETCRPITVDEALHETWKGQDPDAAPQSPIDVWLSQDDARVHRVQLIGPGTTDDIYFEVAYSRFNEVTVTAPE